MDLKQKLSAKITSKEEFYSLIGVEPTISHRTAPDGTITELKSYRKAKQELSNRALPIEWWAEREELRIEEEVYRSTAVTHWLNRNNTLFVHVSRLDPTRVSYSLDAQHGEQDRQLIVNLGKLIKKLYPALAGEAVAALVAEHAAEISDEIEFIEHDKIAETYPSLIHIRSSSGGAPCMSRSKDNYGGLNPAEAYNVPGVRLAVLRDAEGKIKERTLVYEPSETDKRYIRIYPGGETLLYKRLKNKGYKVGSWLGMTFKTIPFLGTGTENMYSFPYLDGDGTFGSPEKSTVALIDGKITCVTNERALKLSKLVRECVTCATNTTGFVRLVNINSSRFSAVDHFTGAQISLLELHLIYHIDGKDCFSMEGIEGFVRTFTWLDGTRVRRHTRKDDTVVADGDYYDKEKLAELEIVKLDEGIYGPECYANAAKTTITVKGRVVRSYDKLKYYTNSGEYTIHAKELNLKGKQKDIKLSAQVYAAHDIELHVTPSGRRVHPNVHDVVELWNGTYDFKRNVTSMHALGVDVFYTKGDMPDTSAGSAVWNLRVAAVTEFIAKLKRSNRYDRCLTLSDLATSAFDRLGGGYLYCYPITDGYRVNRLSPDSSLPCAAQVERITLICNTLANDAAKVTLSIITKLYAEMCAVEAPHYLRDAVKPCADTLLVLNEEAATCSA